MKQDLENSIQNLYDVFQKYTIKGNLRERSCKCCVSNDEIRELLLKPLKELLYDDIYHFMTSVVSTYGDIEDYKHFLPRILDLMGNSDVNLIDDFLTFEKLNYSEWETWDDNEVAAIEKFIEELWYETLRSSKSINNEIEMTFKLFHKYMGVEKVYSVYY